MLRAVYVEDGHDWGIEVQGSGTVDRDSAREAMERTGMPESVFF